MNFIFKIKLLILKYLTHISISDFRTNVLERYFNKDLTITLPDNKKITEIKWFAIYDLSSQVIFFHWVMFPFFFFYRNIIFVNVFFRTLSVTFTFLKNSNLQHCKKFHNYLLNLTVWNHHLLKLSIRKPLN